MNNKNVPAYDEQELFQKAITAKEQENNKEAMEYISEILQENSENAQALNLAGIIYYERNELEKAKNHFVEAIKNDSTLIDAQHNYAEVLIQQKDYDNGVKAFVQILQNHPDNVPAILRLAQLSAEAGHLDNAEEFCDRVLELEPDNDNAQKLRDILPKLREQNQVSEDEQQIQQKLYQKAVRANSAGNTKQAFININEILAKDPNNSRAYNLAGKIFFANGNLENAKKSFVASINCDHDFEEAHLNLAQTYFEMEEYDQSKELYEQLNENNPKNTEVLQKLAEINITMGNQEDALENAETLLKYEPDNSMAQQIVANH